MSLPASTSGSLIPSGSPLCVTLHLDPSLLKRSSRHPRAETPLRVSLPASCASKTSKADAFHAVASGQIAALKRAAAAAVSVPEHMLRIRPHISSNNKASSTAAPVPEPDSVELDLSQPLSLSLRSSRSATTTIVIRSFAESKLDENWTIKVDLSDTSLDLKFLLLPLLQATYAKKNQSDFRPTNAENIILYNWRKGQQCRERMPNHATLASQSINSTSVLRLQYEYPSLELGHGSVHRSTMALLEYDSPDVRNLGTSFRATARRVPGKNCLGVRRFLPDGSRGAYIWQTYREVSDRVTRFSSGLTALGVQPKARIGIISSNRPEWVITDLSCSTHEWTSIPLYDTLGPDAVKFIINHAQVTVVVAATSQLKQIEKVRAECPTLQHVIVMDDLPPDAAYIAAGHTNFTHTFSGVEALGSAKGLVADAVFSGDSLLSINYTSGTTGNPKGAVLTHRNLLSAVLAMNERLPVDTGLAEERFFSYLPLAHIYERTVESLAMLRGAAVGFYQGDTLKLVDDVAELKPSFFPGVPRVWQRIHDRVNAQAQDASWLKAKLFNHALDSKLAQLHVGDNSSSIYDRLVFSKVAAKFGGQLKVMISGAAPISPKVAEFLRIAFQTIFIEGYGLTETCAALSIADMENCVYGTVGYPLSCCEVKLVDVPDMDYRSTDKPCPRGEVWVRGHNVFKAYFKAEAETKECLHPDGWFCTGDVGQWCEDGNLKIIDRKKNLFKLAQGEYIRPEYIEGVYKQCNSIANAYVHGDSTENFLIAIIVPDWEALGVKGAAAQKAQANSPQLYEKIAAEMDAQDKAEKLRGFECVKKFKIVAEDFTPENGLLTPTFKLKRNVAAKQFKPIIAELYSTKPASNKPLQSKL